MHWLLALALAAASFNTHALLMGRDIDGNPVADNNDPAVVFVYDTDLNITWLRDWNYAQTTGHDADGRMSWGDALAWASGLNVGNFSGWRLPIADTICGNDSCIDSELGHVVFTELGNMAGLANTAPFENMDSNFYWTSSEYAPDILGAWVYSTGFGLQMGVEKSMEMFAVAVRDGDVAAASVPEPGSLAVFLAGLAALSMVRLRHRY